MGDSKGGLAAFHATISGSVQGVGFRYSAHREALRLGVSGWVRNLPDGDVEVMAEGKIADLADFREWLDEGPPGAWVQSVTAERLQATGHYSDFFVE